MKTYGEKLKELRKQRDLNPYQLGKLSGVDPGYISRIESGEIKEPKSGVTSRLTRALGVKFGYFYGSNESTLPDPELALSTIEVSIKAYIPVYAEVSAGVGMEPIDYVACTRARPAPESLRAYRVSGLCLSPEIEEWDTLIVDTALSPQNGDLIVCIMENEASVKRFKEDEQGNKWLENNNGKYQPEDVYIHGVVVEFNRKRR